MELKRRDFTVTKVTNICAGHQLKLPYPSKCTNCHGHNYRIAVTVKGPLNEHGMVCDFTLISEVVKTLDHQMVEDHVPGNGTAENIALWIGAMVQVKLNHNEDGRGNTEAKVIRVEVGETDGNLAVWE